MPFNHVGDDVSQDKRGKAGENGVRVPAYTPAPVAQEPFYEAMSGLELTTDQRGTQRHSVRPANLT